MRSPIVHVDCHRGEVVTDRQVPSVDVTDAPIVRIAQRQDPPVKCEFHIVRVVR